MVAFMPWTGYNFEDAILVSERIVRDDIFTSIHIQDFEVGARDTKLGPEEITRDIPNVGEDALKNLAADGVVRIGAEVNPGDILVGKITPKSESELAPEERLLRAIFGEKAADVRDTSLTVPSGVYGIVMDVKVTSQQEARRPFLSLADDDEDKKSKEPRDIEAERQKKVMALEEDLTTSLCNILLGEKIPLDVLDVNSGEIIIPANRKITKTLLARLAKAHDHIQIENSPVQQKIDEIISNFRPKFAEVNEMTDDDFGSDFGGLVDEGGVIKQVRVYIAEKKNLSVGDKLAGRHGNKGVVAKIVQDCDMPFLPDGNPVDIVLNPLGVPSRMNLGQLFETYLGLACKVLGIHAATPVFDGAKEHEIDELLHKARDKQAKEIGGNAWICEDGKTVLYDGRTGEPFDQRVVVGQIYMLKLHHLVTDKIHARATGPYSLVTQQPLGGKAQYGGQRMGEMEVWALEAYGVAYALQELLTVKSDDVGGRTRIYEAIVKGQNTLDAGMPESFSVLMNELRGLCLDMRLLGGDTAQPVADLTTRI
jgi:DNA-directed RNA polymerase subunit beta